MTALEIAVAALEEIAAHEDEHAEFTGCQAPQIAAEALGEIKRKQLLDV